MNNSFEWILIDHLTKEEYEVIKNHYNIIPLYFNDKYNEIIISRQHYDELKKHESSDLQYEELLNLISRNL